MISFLLSAIKIIFVLGFLVLIHEGGHFLVAKFFKVQVNEFSIGFGKELISKKKNETKYVLRMIPFGGYVSMLGEEEKSTEEGSFSELNVPKRIAIVAAGGIVNIIFGLLTYFILTSVIASNFYSTKVDSVVENYGAQIAGIQEGDEIIKINNHKIHVYNEIPEIVQNSNGDNIDVELIRDGEKINIDVTPTEEKSKTIGIYLGTEEEADCKIEYIYPGYPAEEAGLKTGDIITKINNTEIKDYKQIVDIIDNSQKDKLKIEVDRKGKTKEYDVDLKEISNYYLGVTFKEKEKTLLNRIQYGFWTTQKFGLSYVDNIKQLFTGKVSTNQLMGPVGISKTVAGTKNIEDFVYLLALISLSLGITNLLPIPALDGGKILLYIIEAIRRKPMKEKTEIAIQLIGFSLIILLSIYVSYNDILKIL